MDNLAKATPFIAIAALVCGVVGLILGGIAFQKSSQMNEIAVMKDANSVISQSVASLQEEMSGLSKKYATTANLKEVASQTQEGFNAFSEQLTKVRTQSRADTIKVAELESKIQAGGTIVRPVASSSSPSSRSTTTSSTDAAAGPSAVSTVPPGGAEYVIQTGDTLGGVAKKYGLTLDKLLSANPGVQPRYLRVGQKIIIPE